MRSLPIPLFLRPVRRVAIRFPRRAPPWSRLLATAAQPAPVDCSEPIPPLVNSLNASPNTIKLRTYQEECIRAVLSHVEQGHRRLGISLATGAGKTVIFTRLIDRLPPLNEDATQTLILVHRRELVEQALKHCINQYPDKVVEVEMANKYATGTADITIASIQSVISKDRIGKFDPSRFKLILIDECHHGVASSYLKTLEHFGCLDPGKPHPVLVGVSATLSRFDGLKLGAILDYIVYHKDYVEMIKDKWLSDVMFTTVHTSVDLSKVRTMKGGDYNTADLSKAVNTPEANEITVRSWLEKTQGKRKSTLVFCVDIAHVMDMTKTFRNRGIDARFITNNTAKDERGERLNQFKAGSYPVLVNCGIFTEGTDIPGVDCVLLARPTRSKNLLIQMIGRGMRLHPAKKNCHVIDMVGSVDKGIITVPTLFGLDPFEVIDEATPSQLQELKEEQEKLETENSGSFVGQSNRPSLDATTVHFTDYESIFDLLADRTPDEYIRRVSMFAWVRVGSNKYILSVQQQGHLRIDKDEEGLYTCTEVSPSIPDATGWKRLSRARIVMECAQNLESIVHGADTYAKKKFPYRLIANNAEWRSQPVSEVQLETLYRRKPDGDWKERNLTKGQAADIFVKLTHGAQAHYKKIMKRKQKDKEEKEKEEERKKRMEIKVGRIMK